MNMNFTAHFFARIRRVCSSPGGELATTALVAFYVAVCAPCAAAEQHVVSNTEEFAAALEAAHPGDQIIMKHGIYAGEHSRDRLDGVTIRSADPKKPAIFEGGDQGMQLTDPTNVTIRDVVFRKQKLIGLNIDDAESPETPANNIILKNVVVRDMTAEGNHDGIKLSGVDNFVVDGVQVINWGTGGSGVDFVGCHHGIVQNCNFLHNGKGVDGTVLRPKGGCKDITIRANRVQLPIGEGRGIQAGGQTDLDYLRFVDGDSGYEARDIIVEGNVMIGGSSAFSWVNIDGGIFHHNVIIRPGKWVVRILNEEDESVPMVDTQNGEFHDNRIVFNDTDSEFNEPVNNSENVLLDTFQFARNRWLNLANKTPKGSKPTLPTEETDGVYGEVPAADPEAVQVWVFAWGRWVVNATNKPKAIQIAKDSELQRAVAVSDAKFEPLNDSPLSGEWKTAAVAGTSIQLPPFSQAILVKPSVQ
jgi:hypothetical protein